MFITKITSTTNPDLRFCESCEKDISTFSISSSLTSHHITCFLKFVITHPLTFLSHLKYM